MTIGTIAFLLIGTAVLVFCGITGFQSLRKGRKNYGIAVMAAGAVIGLLIIGGCLFYANTEAGKRAYKDQQSSLTGISRTVTVYDINGDVIATYSGKFDVETDNSSYILFDDENGKRHIIYYSTATIIIDEN